MDYDPDLHTPCKQKALEKKGYGRRQGQGGMRPANETGGMAYEARPLRQEARQRGHGQ